MKSILKLVTCSLSTFNPCCPFGQPTSYLGTPRGNPPTSLCPTQSLKLHHSLRCFCPPSYQWISPFPFNGFLLLASFLKLHFFFSVFFFFSFFNENSRAEYYSLPRHSSLAIKFLGRLLLTVTKYSFIQQHSLGTSRRPGTVLATGVT